MFTKIILSPLMLISFFLSSLAPKYISILGWLFGCFLRLIRLRSKTVKANLKLALGNEMTDKQLKKLYAQIYHHTGTLFLEIVRNFTLSKSQFINELHVSEEQMNFLNKLNTEGTGLIAISAHIANWELFPCGIAARGFKVSGIVKKQKGASQNLIEERRKKAGFKVIYTGGTLAKMAEHLKEGRFIGFMVDQHMPGKKGIRANFFGVPAASIRGLSHLAKDTKCLIVPMCIFRQPDGTHKLHISEPIKYIEAHDLPENSESRELKEEYLNTQAYQNAIEKMIRLHPEQWLWMHSRWKTNRTPIELNF